MTAVQELVQDKFATMGLIWRDVREYTYDCTECTFAIGTNTDAVFWSPSTGPLMVPENYWRKWLWNVPNHDRGTLGNVLSEVTHEPREGQPTAAYMQFENGRIYKLWNSGWRQNFTIVIEGPVVQAWLDNGGPDTVGFPAEDRHSFLTSQDRDLLYHQYVFETADLVASGIDYDAKTGAHFIPTTMMSTVLWNRNAQRGGTISSDVTATTDGKATYLRVDTAPGLVMVFVENNSTLAYEVKKPMLS